MSDYATRQEEYKGHPILAICKVGENRPVISFGLSKARAIVENLKAITDFLAEHTKDQQK